MKKLISSMLIVATTMAIGVAKADNISPEQAREASAYYLGHVLGVDKLTASDLQLVYQINNLDQDVPALYFFNSSCGWIVMGGTTVIDPVVAYSTDGLLDIDRLSPSMWWWLTSYAEAIKEIQAMDAENDYPASEQWQTIANRKLTGGKIEQVILLETRWDQGDTYNPSYNLLCPQDPNGEYSVTGCVATALAQLCYYYKYPKNPTGTVKTWFGNTLLKLNLDTVSFDYDLMPLTLSRSTDSASVMEVAKLSYALGLAVKMSYSPDGSGSNHSYARSGMVNNFKYESPVLVSRQSDSDTSFVYSVRREVEKGNVVYMGGTSSISGGRDAAGHAWLVTGYEPDNMSYMYFNWGWGGSGNGWFNLRTNNMRISGMGYNFNLDQSILLGLVPPADSLLGIAEADNTVLGTAYPNPAALSVRLPYSTDRTGDMNIFSIDGKLVASQRVEAGRGEVEVKVTGMPAGIYIYRLNSQSGKFIVR